jgi:hypothetical protein
MPELDGGLNSMIDAAFDAAAVSTSTPAATERLSDTPAPAADPVKDTAVDEPAIADDPIDETPEPVVDEPAADDPAAPPAEEAPKDTADDLPEDAVVRVGRNGKEEVVYPKARGMAIYAGYKTAQEAEQILGEPLTPDALTSRQTSHEWLSAQNMDAISPNPKEQGYVFANLFRTAAEAISRGEISHDPLETMGEAFLNTMAQVSPENHQRTVNFVLNQHIQQMYDEAAQTSDVKLWKTTQNLDYKLNNTFLKDEDMRTRTKPTVDSREQDLRQREQNIAQHQRQQQKVAWEGWNTGTKSSIQQSVDSAVNEAIPAELRKSFESSPEGKDRLANTIRLLNVEIREALNGDQKWVSATRDLYTRASRAASEEVRESLRTQIVQRYQARARQVIAANAAKIIGAQSAGLKTANAAKHNKLAEAQQQKNTPGTGTPAPRFVPQRADARKQTWDEHVDSVFG